LAADGSQNGYTAISNRALERINPDTINPWYGYCNDLLTKLNVFGFKVKDVVMPAKYGNEKSKIRYGRYMFKVSWLLLKDFIWRLKMKYVWMSFHPLILFYAFGIILAPIGLFGGILIVLQICVGWINICERIFIIIAFYHRNTIFIVRNVF
jgi:hypothetical protein